MLHLLTSWLHGGSNNNKRMYSLKCNYYSKKFNSINELVDDIVVSGMDPNYSITKDDKDIGEQAIDFISF